MDFFGDNDTTDTDVPDDGNGFLDDAHDACVDLSDDVGDATNWMYDTIAGKSGLPDDITDNVGDVVGGFVEDHWEDVCDLPENIGNNIQDAFSDSPDISMPDSDTSPNEE